MPITVSTEARIAVRRFKAAVDAQANRVHDALRGKELDSLVQAFMFKTGKGRDRALAKLKQLVAAKLEVATLKPRQLLWSQLCCTKHLLLKPRDPGETQDAVCLEYILVHFPNNVNEFRLETGAWALEIPDHALGRLFQRNPRADATMAIRHAHHALQGTKLTGIPGPDTSVYVAAPGGVFAGNVVFARIDGNLTVYFRARTYLAEDQLGANQTPLPPGKPSWGQSILLPPPLLASTMAELRRSLAAEDQAKLLANG